MHAASSVSAAVGTVAIILAVFWGILLPFAIGILETIYGEKPRPRP